MNAVAARIRPRPPWPKRSLRMVLMGVAAATLVAACSRAGGPTGAADASVEPAPGTSAAAAPARSEPTDARGTAGASPTGVGDPARVERLTMASAVLGSDQRYRVYLPAGYDQRGEARYPVIYLLHGAGATEDQWDDVEVDAAATRLIAGGQIPPVILVLPAADTNRVSRRAGDPTLRYVLDELIPRIDADFATLADGRHRAIGGISRGGGYALQIAAAAPDRFTAVAGHSPANLPDAGGLATLAGSGLQIAIDVGNSDGLHGTALALADELENDGASPILRVWPGGHDRAYWRRHTEDYLRFYTATWPR